MKESLIWTEKRQCCRSDILPGNKFGSSSVLAKAKIGLRTANPWNIRYNSICHRTFQWKWGMAKYSSRPCTYSTNIPLCTSLCADAPSPTPQIKNLFLLEKASVLATLHEPAELRRLRSIGHGLFIQPMRTTKCGVILCRRIRLRSMKWQERPEGDLHLSLRSLAIVGFLGSLNSLSIFSPMLPSWNRPIFKCPPITVNQSQLLFITNFNGEIMQSVQLFICTPWMLRDGCQSRFIQFAMPSTGWSNAVYRRSNNSYQSHLYFEATSLWLFTSQPIPIVGLLIS